MLRTGKLGPFKNNVFLLATVPEKYIGLQRVNIFLLLTQHELQKD